MLSVRPPFFLWVHSSSPQVKVSKVQSLCVSYTQPPQASVGVNKIFPQVSAGSVGEVAELRFPLGQMWLEVGLGWGRG